MAEPRHLPTSPDPGCRLPDGARAGAARHLPGALIAFAAVTAGTAVLGAVAGLVWLAVAPRALIVVAGRDLAAVVNPESSAFIEADGWFVLLTLAGGCISGLLGYLLAVRRHGHLRWPVSWPVG